MKAIRISTLVLTILGTLSFLFLIYQCIAQKRNDPGMLSFVLIAMLYARLWYMVYKPSEITNTKPRIIYPLFVSVMLLGAIGYVLYGINKA